MSTTQHRVARAVIAVSTFVVVALAAATPATAEVVEIELQNGEKFKAEIIEEREDAIVVDHPIFGRQEIPRDQIKKEEEKPVEPGLFGTKVLRGWERSAGFGVAGSTGNSKDVSINATLVVNRKADRYEGRFRSQYFYSSARSITTKNDFRMGYLHDFLFAGSPWIISLNGAYDYDDFQTWRNRLSFQVAPGYKILDNERFELVGRLGVGVSHEFGSDPETDPDKLSVAPSLAAGADSDTKPEGVISAEFGWNIDEWQRFTASTTYFPNLKDLPRFRMTSNAEYSLKLAMFQALSLKAGLTNEYVSGQPGDNNSLNYYGNVVYEF